MTDITNKTGCDQFQIAKITAHIPTSISGDRGLIRFSSLKLQYRHVLTIRNATILCESYTCLSVRGSLIMRDSFIGKRTVSRYTDRQGTVAIQHSSNAIASSIELHISVLRFL